MATTTTVYEPIDPTKDNGGQVKDGQEQRTINTNLRHIWYGCGLLAIILASIGFWIASRYQPLLLSLSATQTVLNSAKAMTFVWTLLGTILAFTTGTLFNQLLKVSLQQLVTEQGVRIGIIEFWTRVYSRKWLHDHKNERIFLSAFSIVFAIAFGLLVSAYTGLITPTSVYLQDSLWSSELDLSTEGFWNWYQSAGDRLLQNCDSVKTYGTGHRAVSLAACPQVKDPIPYLSAGIASIEAKYAEYDPTTSVLGISFNGTTKGVLPHGWNAIPFFDTFPKVDQPPVLNYNYSMIQQGISTNVTCEVLGQNSNITWKEQGAFLVTTTNGNNAEDIFIQNVTFGNQVLGIDEQDNLLLSGGDFIATFSNVNESDDYEYRLELASYGSYNSQWKLPNMSCVLAPYLTEVNVTYSNSTGLFAGEVVSITGGLLRIPYELNEVNNWLFRVTEVLTGNQIINSIIALQNTPSYERGIFGNFTIDWPTAMELFIQGVTELHATRLRMIMSAEINSTNFEPDGFRPVKDGQVSSWRLGYNGETAPIATLFPLQGFILICAIFVVVIGTRTGVKHVSHFDPTNTTHLIVASAQGASRGGLHALKGEDAIHADARALNLKIEYNHMQGFQEVSNLSNSDYTELNDLNDRRDSEGPLRLKSALFSRISFSKGNTR